MIFLIILLCSIILVLFNGICMDDGAKVSKDEVGVINIIIGIVIVVCILRALFTPTAMDVYKGRTELEVTYKGKIPIDSVVVYKK